MTADMTRRFNRRSFATLLVALAGAGLPVTGLANHLLQMEPMTVARHAWMAAHTSLGVVFAVGAVSHLALNWRAFLGYLRGAVMRRAIVSRELAWALAVVGVTTMIAAAHAHLVP